MLRVSAKRLGRLDQGSGFVMDRTVCVRGQAQMDTRSQAMCVSALPGVHFVDVDMVDRGLSDGHVEPGEQLFEGLWALSKRGDAIVKANRRQAWIWNALLPVLHVDDVRRTRDAINEG